MIWYFQKAKIIKPGNSVSLCSTMAMFRDIDSTTATFYDLLRRRFNEKLFCVAGGRRSSTHSRDKWNFSHLADTNTHSQPSPREQGKRNKQTTRTSHTTLTRSKHSAQARVTKMEEKFSQSHLAICQARPWRRFKNNCNPFASNAYNRICY